MTPAPAAGPAATLAVSSPPLDSDATRWQGRGVRAEAVARQLMRLRYGAGDEDGYALTRASVMNLIACVAGGDDAERVIRAVDELAVRHPSRVIVLAPQGGNGFSLDAEVVLHNHAMEAHGLIFERALLRPRGADPASFDTLVIPLLIPHLQSFLWWLGDPDPADPGLRSLASICDRLIIDSELGAGSRLAEISDRLVVPAGGRGAILGDMSWTRLEAWREALARVFEDEGRRRHLDHLTEVEITAGRRSPRRPPGPGELLLAGWLASRLGHARPTPADGGVRMQRGGGLTRATSHSVPGPLFTFPATRRSAASPISGVRLRGSRGDRQLEVSLAEERGAWTLSVTETGLPPDVRRLHLAPLPPTEVLSRELARMGRDRVYEDALQMGARIEAALTSGG